MRHTYALQLTNLWTGMRMRQAMWGHAKTKQFESQNSGPLNVGTFLDASILIEPEPPTKRPTKTVCAKCLGFSLCRWLCEINSNEKSLQKFLLRFGGKSFESKRNETKTERSRNENETERSWVAVWWPKFGGMSGSPCGGRNFGRNLGRRVVAEILAEKSFPSALT